jgi:hypothetical protein
MSDYRKSLSLLHQNPRPWGYSKIDVPCSTFINPLILAD